MEGMFLAEKIIDFLYLFEHYEGVKNCRGLLVGSKTILGARVLLKCRNAYGQERIFNGMMVPSNHPGLKIKVAEGAFVTYINNFKDAPTACFSWCPNVTIWSVSYAAWTMCSDVELEYIKTQARRQIDADFLFNKKIGNPSNDAEIDLDWFKNFYFPSINGEKEVFSEELNPERTDTGHVIVVRTYDIPAPEGLPKVGPKKTPIVYSHHK